LSTQNTRDYKVTISRAFEIVGAYDTLLMSLLVPLGFLILMVVSPLWISPLLGIPIGVGYLYIVIYWLLNMVLLQFVKVRAKHVLERQLAKRAVAAIKEAVEKEYRSG
jgi:hypothetical protein